MMGVERIHVELSCLEITKRTDAAIGCGRFISSLQERSAFRLRSLSGQSYGPLEWGLISSYGLEPQESTFLAALFISKRKDDCHARHSGNQSYFFLSRQL